MPRRTPTAKAACWNADADVDISGINNTRLLIVFSFPVSISTAYAATANSKEFDLGPGHKRREHVTHNLLGCLHRSGSVVSKVLHGCRHVRRRLKYRTSANLRPHSCQYYAGDFSRQHFICISSNSTGSTSKPDTLGNRGYSSVVATSANP